MNYMNSEVCDDIDNNCDWNGNFISVFSRDLILEGKNGGIACFGGESNGLT